MQLVVEIQIHKGKPIGADHKMGRGTIPNAYDKDREKNC